MSVTTIPSSLLFNLDEPGILLVKRFEEVWSCVDVDSVYPMRSGKKMQSNGTLSVKHSEQQYAEHELMGGM